MGPPTTSTSNTHANFRTMVSEYIEDAVSGEPMRKAVTLVPCGHTFDEDTVIQCLASKKLCPLDRQPIEKYVRNYAIRQLADAVAAHPSEEELMAEAQAHFLRGKELCEKGKQEAAIEALLQALRLSPSLASISATTVQDFSSVAMVSLYREILHFHFPEESENLAKKAPILDKIYNIGSGLGSEAKVPLIFESLFKQAQSLSPLEFESKNLKNEPFTLANYTSYLLNINRLLLWQKLPAGEDYLSQPEIKALTLKQKGELLKAWIKEHGKNISELELGDTGLTFLPPEIKHFSQLQKLNLSINQLTVLPASIGQLSQLKELWLKSNLLTTLPSTLGQLSQLKGLDLSRNQLAVIPAILGKLSHLKAFWLDHNQLTTIPATLGQLSQLQWLSLSYNQLTDLPVEIKRLDRCTTVLNGNPLKAEGA
ncbi:hypothetical protein [Parachlamydia sp. AcF125]|uniref:hypothetical protein n=1 Tax=Parachlamydia sp. AcF125 TaxID=2795736 RepID=UPI001BC93A2C|nr:hypothetical protein [Parachlamydia sp. AcF125]MBS4168916.1 E3 ubiquitin-protein ligase SspH2 [Parachlamydia sp. AcF125]